MSDYPKCFDSRQQFVSWQTAAKGAKGGPVVKSYCMDCTPEYRKKMHDQGRCSHEVIFKNYNGEMVGIRIALTRVPTQRTQDTLIGALSSPMTLKEMHKATGFSKSTLAYVVGKLVDEKKLMVVGYGAGIGSPRIYQAA